MTDSQRRIDNFFAARIKIPMMLVWLLMEKETRPTSAIKMILTRTLTLTMKIKMQMCVRLSVSASVVLMYVLLIILWN